ncbi:hypothetical protein ACN28S_49970 [Cystobacter fuscus]
MDTPLLCPAHARACAHRRYLQAPSLRLRCVPAHGGARSVLCLPLSRQEQLSGVLYLENHRPPMPSAPRG